MDNKYLKLMKSIRELQRFLDKLAKFISSERKHNILEDKSKAKEIFLNKFDEFDDLSQNIEILLIQSGLEHDEIDLEEFLSGMFKKPKKPKKNKPNRFKKPNRREEAEFEFEQFMESLTGRPNGRKNFRQSPKFRKLNQSFKYEKDWALKSTEGYGNDFILSLDDNLVKYYFPNFDRKNETTYPPKARWINYADKYTEDYINDLESPWCFRSALQCYELPITSREFEFELKKMEFVGQEAVNLYLEYCTQLGVIEISDDDIDYLKKVIKKGNG